MLLSGGHLGRDRFPQVAVQQHLPEGAAQESNCSSRYLFDREKNVKILLSAAIVISLPSLVVFHKENHEWV